MAINWAQVTQKEQQHAEVYVSTIHFYIYAYISTFNYTEFLIQNVFENRS